MSAAVGWEPAPTPVRPGRPTLVLLPGGQRPAPRVAPAPASPTRLTWLGRLLVACLLGAGIVLGLTLVRAGTAGALEVDHAVDVVAGQTLSQVAARELPQLPTREAVARIQLANRLSSDQVHAGQRLLIPVAR